MGSIAVVVGAKPGRDDSVAAVKGWEAEDYPSMGEPDQIRVGLNKRIADAGLASPWFDEGSGVCLPVGVEAIRFVVADDSLRSIWISRPSAELVEILCRWGRVAGWRVFDVVSETECMEGD
jgi:hypothetical protein